MSKLFLSVDWENLILATYSIEPEIRAEYMPQELEPDAINGKVYINLIAFDFNNTKVLGVKIPFHINSTEINFRFYVKDKYRRCVVFIR